MASRIPGRLTHSELRSATLHASLTRSLLGKVGVRDCQSRHLEKVEILLAQQCLLPNVGTASKTRIASDGRPDLIPIALRHLIVGEAPADAPSTVRCRWSTLLMADTNSVRFTALGDKSSFRNRRPGHDPPMLGHVAEPDSAMGGIASKPDASGCPAWLRFLHR